MNFIFSLAHFCEVHGPTSILCTQLLPPSCSLCTSPSDLRNNRGSVSAPVTAPSTRPNSIKSSASSSSNISSPNISPPLSPKIDPITTAPDRRAITNPYKGSTKDVCANCNITLPKTLSERLPIRDGQQVPVLRSRESVITSGAGHSSKDWREDQFDRVEQSRNQHRRRQSHQQDRERRASIDDLDYRNNSTNNNRRRSLSSAASSTFSNDLPPISSASSSSSEEDLVSKGLYIPPHQHDLTYLSTRFPSTQSRYSAVQRACIRALSCESLPTQTGPIFVGDTDTGYTIAYVFRLNDPVARGGRRTYALLCLCPDVKKIVSSYGYVTSVFEGLVTRIRDLATLATPAPKSSNCPEGFLRRAPRTSGGKDLAELVGREQLFVEVHACFATLLGGLARRFGCLDEASREGMEEFRTAIPANMMARLRRN